MSASPDGSGPGLIDEGEDGSTVSENPKTSKILVVAYAVAFAVALPLALTAWSATVPVHFSVWVPPAWLGVCLALLGGALCLWAIVVYIARTGSLPVMLVSPNKAIVTGPYGLLTDPIYTGFSILVFGVAALLANPFAFWIIAPAVSVATYCYVLGVEARVRPDRTDKDLALFGIPQSDLPLSRGKAVSVLFAHLSAVCAALFVLSATAMAALWGSLSLLIVVVGFRVAMPRGDEIGGARLRSAIVSIYVGFGLFLVIAYLPGAAAGGWPMLAIAAVAGGVVAQLAPTILPVASVAAVVAVCAILASLRIEQMIVLAALGVTVRFLPALYGAAVGIAESIANSWSAFRIGPVRVINYSIFAFASATIGCLIFAGTAGERAVLGMTIISLATLAGAALWGQVLESTGRLARPFGYFGAMIGAVLGTVLAAAAMGVSVASVGAALVLAAPWIQAIGRLRCLVQGCCHGRPINLSEHGIRYRSQRARAVAIGGFFDTPIYPTQLFSLLSNLFLGLLLIRLALSGAPGSIIIAVYWLGAGASRFAEEAFRGEPQTKMILGLKIYQWFAVVLIGAGVVISYFPSDPIPGFSMPSLWSVVTAVLLGLIYTVAMGVDLPNSRARLSQLTPQE